MTHTLMDGDGDRNDVGEGGKIHSRVGLVWHGTSEIPSRFPAVQLVATNNPREDGSRFRYHRRLFYKRPMGKNEAPPPSLLLCPARRTVLTRECILHNFVFFVFGFGHTGAVTWTGRIRR